MWNDDCMTPTLLLPVAMIAFTVVACLGAVVILGVAWRSVGKPDLVPLTLAQLTMLLGFWGMALFIYLALPGLYPLAVGVYVMASASIVHVLKRKLLYPAFGFDKVDVRNLMLRVDRRLLAYAYTQTASIALATSAMGFTGQKAAYNALEITQLFGSIAVMIFSVIEIRWFTRVLRTLTSQRPVTGTTTNYEVERALARIQGIGNKVPVVAVVLAVNIAFCAASLALGTVPFADLLICTCLVLVQPVFVAWHALLFMPSRAKPPSSVTMHSKLTDGADGTR